MMSCGERREGVGTVVRDKVGVTKSVTEQKVQVRNRRKNQSEHRSTRRTASAGLTDDDEDAAAAAEAEEDLPGAGGTYAARCTLRNGELALDEDAEC